jgi:leucyl-tRNA synthetase
MKRYDPKSIEPKWQQVWADTKLYAAVDDDPRDKYYYLVEFPYPSGDGLHVGHVLSYTALDIMARHKRMQGFNVLYPMGFDEFGLPTENYAIKHKIAPQLATERNVATFERQLKSLGLSFDWDREVRTSDPNYYKWTQWIFLQLHQKGLAYQAEIAINWCPFEKTGLANEEVVDGKHERCGTPVERKLLRQWMLAITKYADRLASDLKSVDYLDRISSQQVNWIGRSEGAEITFEIKTDELNGADIVFLHAYKDTSKSVFWPKLKQSLEQQGAHVFAPNLPNSSEPNIDEQVDYVLKHHKFTPKTIIVAHSLGGIVALKLIEKLQSPVARLILAGTPIRTTDFKDGERRLPLEKAWDWKLNPAPARKWAGRIDVLISSNDHIVPQAHGHELAEALGVTAEVHQTSEPHFNGLNEPSIAGKLLRHVTVYTTRPDTIFGATFLVVSPELANKWLDAGWHPAEPVREYIHHAINETELSRQEDRKKTGVDTGLHAVHPLTGDLVPVWVADYVLGSYGTGAIMAVPAHDERDGEFARTFDLPIKQVVMPHVVDSVNPPRPGEPDTTRIIIHAIVKHPDKDEVISLRWKDHPWHTLITGGVEEGEDVVEAAKREIREETGFTKLKFVKRLPYIIQAEFYAAHKHVNRKTDAHFLYFELENLNREPVAKEETAKHEVEWIKQSDLHKLSPIAEIGHVINWLQNGDHEFTGYGVLTNSGDFNGLSGAEAQHAIIKALFDAGAGKHTTKYKLRDWIFSRQHYWGEPIPIIHCPTDGAVPVPETDLPVTLPVVDHYEPIDTGESPLAAIPEFVGTTCPKCGGPAKRETDTMPNWAGSSWYYLRYTDPHNAKAFADPAKLKYWTPVDLYNGGMEHTTLHLLYSRFWHKFLYDQGLVPTPEPYAKRTSHGMILGPDGQKMSKSKGNVINPDHVVEKYGADTIRLYEMFMGPFDEAKSWSEDHLAGVSRFLYRVWTLSQDLIEAHHHTPGAPTGPSQENTGAFAASVDRRTHQTLKRVHDHIGDMSFNLMISALMEYINFLSEPKTKTALLEPQYAALAWRTLRTLILMLAPSAPHIAEELWEQTGGQGSVHVAAWPAYDPELIKEDVITVVVQINGKVRANLALPAGATDDDLKQAAHADPKVAAHLKGHTVLKTIVVPRKLVNFVVKS